MGDRRMTFEFWINAERFYTFLLPYLGVALALGLIVLFFVLSYAGPKSKSKKYAWVVYGSSLAVVITYGVWGHIRYQDWLVENESITPGIRTHEMFMGFRSVEENEVIRLSRESASLGAYLSQSTLYDAETVSEPFDYKYLGSTENDVHYFEYEDERVIHVRGSVEFTGEATYLEGAEYHLVDEQFEEIGFINDHDIIFERVVINEQDAEEAPQEWAHVTQSIEDIFTEWHFGSQP